MFKVSNPLEKNQIVCRTSMKISTLDKLVREASLEEKKHYIVISYEKGETFVVFAGNRFRIDPNVNGSTIVFVENINL